MALNVSLKLKIDADEIKGESGVLSLDREDSIECLSFSQSAFKHMDKKPGFQLHTEATFLPIRITKRIDGATPFIAKAFFKHEKVGGVFRFFRPDPGGSGGEQHFFTMSIENGRIAEHEIISPDLFDDPSKPPLETVGFTFRSLSWEYMKPHSLISLNY